jgi:hypothetical protein
VKINRRTILFLCIAVFFVAAILLYFNYSKQAGLFQTLQQSYNTQNSALLKVAADKVSLNSQVAAANAQVTQLQNQLTQSEIELAAKQQRLSVNMDPIYFEEILFNTASRYEVRITSISLNDGGISPINKNFNRTVYSIGAAGTSEGITGFMNALATDADFQYSSIDTLTRSNSQALPVAGSSPGKAALTTTTGVTVNLQITLYNFINK